MQPLSTNSKMGSKKSFTVLSVIVDVTIWIAGEKLMGNLFLTPYQTAKVSLSQI